MNDKPALDLDALADLAKAATPGPWWVDGNGDIIQTKHITRDVWFIPHKADDTVYIAAMDPTTALALIDAARHVGNARALLEDASEGRVVLYGHILRTWSEEDQHSFGLMLLRRTDEDDAALVDAARRTEAAEREVMSLITMLVTPNRIGSLAGVPIYGCRMCDGSWSDGGEQVHIQGCQEPAVERALKGETP